MDFSQYINGNILNLCVKTNINIDELVKFLQRNTYITCLGLICCEIKAKGIEKLANLPQNITSLNLSWDDIGAEGAEALTKNLPQNITSLYLSGNNIGDEGAKALAKNLRQNITSLDLSGNNIRTEGVAALAQLKLGERLTFGMFQKKRNKSIL